MEGEKGKKVEVAEVVEEKRSRFRKICVFFAYNSAKVEGGIDLVYGGGSIGLMGIVCQAVHEGGRHVLGVITKSSMAGRRAQNQSNSPRSSNCFRQCMKGKLRQPRRADAFIALPGGYGTLVEVHYMGSAGNPQETGWTLKH